VKCKLYNAFSHSHKKISALSIGLVNISQKGEFSSTCIGMAKFQTTNSRCIIKQKATASAYCDQKN